MTPNKTVSSYIIHFPFPLRGNGAGGVARDFQWGAAFAKPLIPTRFLEVACHFLPLLALLLRRGRVSCKSVPTTLSAGPPVGPRAIHTWFVEGLLVFFARASRPVPVVPFSWRIGFLAATIPTRRLPRLITFFEARHHNQARGPQVGPRASQR